MGVPSTPEGEQAKKSMETRHTNAKNAIQDLVEKICIDAVVYLAGGISIQSGTLKENIEEALSSIADRQFPDFKSKADFLNWGQALTKALAGDPDALTASYKGDIDKHHIASEILRFMGNTSKTGKDIRNQFSKSPYGWSQDAIDTIVIMLKNMQHISTAETNLNVAKINQATFKIEIHILGAKDKIIIRKLFQDAGINCPPNHDIFSYSNEYLDRLKKLVLQISGDAPRLEPIDINFIKEIENKQGNERLLEIISHKDDLHFNFNDWTTKAKVVAKREPMWKLLSELINHAPDDAEMAHFKIEYNAIGDNRLLLQEPDPIQPILNGITTGLADILNKRLHHYNSDYDKGMDKLKSNEYFKKLTPEEKHAILVKYHLITKADIISLDSHALNNQLNAASLKYWDTRVAALPGWFQSALDDAITLSAPQAKTYNLPRKTIINQADIDAYLTELKTDLETLLKASSSIILR